MKLSFKNIFVVAVLMTARTLAQNVYNTPNSNSGEAEVETSLIDVSIIPEWDLKEATSDAPLASRSTFKILSPKITFSSFTDDELHTIEVNRPENGIVNTIINDEKCLNLS